MKVKELIEKLKEVDQNYEVVAEGNSGYNYRVLGIIYIRPDEKIVSLLER
jgi:hypothetical protein